MKKKESLGAFWDEWERETELLQKKNKEYIEKCQREAREREEAARNENTGQGGSV